MSGWQRCETESSTGNRVLADVWEGTGPTLVLIPGTWGNARTRGPFVERLDADLRLVCVALAGQDDNWPPPREPSIPQFSEDVRRLADHLGLSRFFVGGNSLGGMIAIDLLRLSPERILGAIAIEGWTHWTVKREAFDDDTSSTLNDDQRAFLAEVRRALLDRWDPDLRETYGTMWQQWDGWDILATAQAPVLEIWGDRGRPRPDRSIMRIPDRENITLEWIAGASHALLIEAPDHLATLINAFVKAHRDGPPTG